MPCGEEVEDRFVFGHLDGLGCFGRGLKFEPEKGVGREGERVGLRADRGEGDVAEHLDRDHAGEAARSSETGCAKRERLATQRTRFAVAVFGRSARR